MYQNRINYLKYYKRLKQLSQNPLARVSGLVSLTFFTIAFFGMFAISPTLKTIAQLNKQIEDTEAVNSKLKSKVKDLEKAEIVYSQVLESLDLVNRVLPEKNEFERLAWQISWLAVESGVEITNSSFGEFVIVGSQDKAEGKIQLISLDLSVSGSYNKIKAFLKKITEIDRLIEIETVSLTKNAADGGGKSQALTANLKLKADYFDTKAGVK